jgi:hypothetical protein
MEHVHQHIYGIQGRWVCGDCHAIVPFGYRKPEEYVSAENAYGKTVAYDFTIKVF